jgi:Carboxypeptidase regulatory-like domain
VTCDTHAHMRAYILSFEHPYFTVTDGDGRFQIDQVPAGSYTLKAWHEGWRIQEYDQDGRPQYEEPYLMTVEVRVLTGETSEVEFQLETRE